MSLKALKTTGNKAYVAVAILLRKVGAFISSILTASFILGVAFFSGYGAFYTYTSQTTAQTGLFVGILMAAVTGAGLGRLQRKAEKRKEKVEELEAELATQGLIK